MESNEYLDSQSSLIYKNKDYEYIDLTDEKGPRLKLPKLDKFPD